MARTPRAAAAGKSSSPTWKRAPAPAFCTRIQIRAVWPAARAVCTLQNAWAVMLARRPAGTVEVAWMVVVPPAVVLAPAETTWDGVRSAVNMRGEVGQ